MAKWQQEETQALWLAAGLAILLTLVGVILIFTRIYLKRRVNDAQKMADMRLDHQKKLLNDSIIVQENERQRIASDLHDELISKLNILLLTNYSNEEKDSTELLQNCIKSARRISHDLSPPLLEQNTLLEFIEELLSHFRNSFEVEYHFVEHQIIDISGKIKLQLIRIIQEILNNTLKHAQAKTIGVNLRITNSYLGLSIKDDGNGFDVEQHKAGLGLSNIEMRTQLLNGTYKVRSTIGKGTTYFFLFSLASKKINDSTD